MTTAPELARAADPGTLPTEGGAHQLDAAVHGTDLARTGSRRKPAPPRIGVGVKDVAAARASAAQSLAVRRARLVEETAELERDAAALAEALARGEVAPPEPVDEASQVLPAPPSALERPAVLGKPTIIVQNLHVVYRVLITGKRTANKGNRKLEREAASRGIREIHAVNDVSFVAHEGEAIGLIGVNGSGKSTLLRAIAGLQPSAGGRVWAEADPTLLGVNATLFGELSGERNILIGGLAMGMSPAEIQRRAPEIADFAAIGEFIDLPMMTYSSGMGSRLRFAIASATVHRILLIDEALATGDSAFQRRSEARINELRQSAGTVFVVSHSEGVIRSTCSRTIWMHKGEMIMDGLTDEVLECYNEFSQGRR